MKSELGALKLEAPTVVMRGKPQGQPTYNVFVVAGIAPKDGGRQDGGGRRVAKSWRTSTHQRRSRPGGQGGSKASWRPPGGSWERWQKQVAPFQAAVRKKLKSAPPAIKALPGQDGFLFYRAALDYVVGGDLEKQPRKKNPLPVIKQWKTFLADQGVDFLFVPVPTKAEIFPDKLDPAGASLKGKVVNPQARKLLLSLSKAGVEVVDLWTPFLKARSRSWRIRAVPAPGHALDQPGARARRLGDRRAHRPLPLGQAAPADRSSPPARRTSPATAICSRACASPTGRA